MDVQVHLENPFFQVIYSEENTKWFHKNPGQWKTMYKCVAYLHPITAIFRLLNCSANFYTYKLLQYHNNKVENERRQNQGQQDREMVTLKTTKTEQTDDSFNPE